MKCVRPFAFASGGLVAAVAIALTGAISSGAPPSEATPTVSVSAARSWAAAAVANDSALATDPAAHREAVIQQCMASAGWEYRPLDWATINAGLEQLRASLKTDENSLLTESGYGVTAAATRSLPQVHVDGDPNVELVAALSPAQKSARGSALGQCLVAARDAVPEPKGSDVDDISPRVAEAQRNAQNDPRMIAATNAWVQCMSERGFQYSSRAAVVSDVEARVDAVRRAFGSNDLSALQQNPGQAPKPAQKLDAARSYEMAVAAADLACKGELDAVAPVVEQEYLDAAFQGAEPGVRIVTDPSQRPEAIR